MYCQRTFELARSGLELNLPGPGKLRTRYLWGLDKLVHEMGADPREIFAAQGVSPDAFDDPDNEIDCISAVNLLEYCSQYLQYPLFGLHLAENQDPDALGCVLALARSAPTWREALQCLVDFVPVAISPECEIEMAAVGGTVELRWQTSVGLGHREQVYFHGLALFMKTLRMLSEKHFQPSYASLCFSVRRPESELLQQRLGCRIYCNSSFNGIAFPRAILDLPIPTANRMLFNLLKNGLAELRASARAGLVERVEAYIRKALPLGCCSVEDCARDLLMSTRTLQKRLTQVNVKFSDVVRSERIKLAKHALLWTDFTLDEIAFHLGYSEQTSFGRAFKQAAGLTPKEFRLLKGQGQAAVGELGLQAVELRRAAAE